MLWTLCQPIIVGHEWISEPEREVGKKTCDTHSCIF